MAVLAGPHFFYRSMLTWRRLATYGEIAVQRNKMLGLVAETD
jgi:hypothetical protein